MQHIYAYYIALEQNLSAQIKLAEDLTHGVQRCTAQSQFCSMHSGGETTNNDIKIARLDYISIQGETLPLNDCITGNPWQRLSNMISI